MICRGCLSGADRVIHLYQSNDFNFSNESSAASMEKIAESQNDQTLNDNKTKSMIGVASHGSLSLAIFLLLLVHFLGTSKLAAQEMVKSPSLAGSAFVLIDPSLKISFEDILRDNYRGEFKPIANTSLNIGFRKAAIWVKLSIPSETSGEGFLTFTPNYLDFVDIFVAKPGIDNTVSDFVKYEAGDHRPLLKNGISGIDSAVAISYSQGKTTTIYVHVINLNSATQLNLDLGLRYKGSQDSASKGLLYGTWFGGMFILLLTQLVFFFFSRKSEYPLLALSTLGVIMIYFGNLGLSHIYLFSRWGAGNDAFIGFSAWAGLAASALAYMKILNLRRYAPKVRFFYLFTAFCGLVGVGFALTGRTVVFGPFGSILSISGVFVTVFCSLYLVNKEGAASKLRAAAFCSMGVGATLTMLQRLGIQALPNWTLHAYGAAILVQTLLLTGSLAVRLRDLEIKNHKMHKDALRQARSAERFAGMLVEEKTKELVEARITAENALRAEIQSQTSQVRFLEVVSHQYRTPLAAIRSSVDSIELALPANDLENRTRISRIRRSIVRLVDLLEANLLRSRIQGPSYKPKMRIIHVGEFIRKSHRRVADMYGVEIDLIIKKELGDAEIEADPGMLELALTNLIDNSVKYSITGQVPVIRLSAFLRDEDVVIEVSDEGKGIFTDELPDIFNKFTRGSNADTVEGSGVGLYLVSKIVAIHRGIIESESIPSHGTQIRMLIPRRLMN